MKNYIPTIIAFIAAVLACLAIFLPVFDVSLVKTISLFLGFISIAIIFYAIQIAINSFNTYKNKQSK